MACGVYRVTYNDVLDDLKLRSIVPVVIYALS
jgi:hypothetical protein